MPRRYEDRGLFIEDAPNNFRVEVLKLRSSDIGAGVFEVHVGPRRFSCLRLLSPDDTDIEKATCLYEVFMNKKGRMIYKRNYLSKWKAHESNVAVATAGSVVLNGAEFHPWYDDLTGLALGLYN